MSLLRIHHSVVIHIYLLLY